MADTERTLAQLLVLLADNTTGAINEQVMRDFAVSVFNPSRTISAAGTTQGTATALATTALANVVTVVASGTGVRLSGRADPVMVANRGANTLSVYPPSGAQIETAAANVPFLIAPGYYATFLFPTSTQCYVNAKAVIPNSFYISAAGSDAAAGTSSAPWATLGHAIAVGLSAGDTVYLNGGDTFRENNLRLPSGTNWATYGTGKPIINGSVVVSSWTLNSGAVYYATFAGAATSPMMIWENGVQGTAVGSIGGIVAIGQFFLDDTAHRLYYRTRGGGSPAGYTIEFDNGNWICVMGGSNGSMTGITVTQSGDTILYTTFNSGAVQGWVLTDCTFSRSGSNGFTQISGSNGLGFTCRRCSFSNNVGIGFTGANVSGMLFEDCQFVGNSSTGCTTNTASGGNGPSLFRRCTSSGNGEDGFTSGQYSINDVYEDCIAFGNGTLVNDRTGMKTFGTNTRFSNCVSYANNTSFTLGCGFQVDRTGSGTPIQATGTVIKNCTAFGNMNSGISIIGDNTTVLNCSLRWNLTSGLEFAGVSVAGFISQNNKIFQNGAGAAGNLQIRDTNGLMASATGVAMDYDNVFSSATHTNLIKWGATSYATLATFVAAFPAFEPHGIEAIG